MPEDTREKDADYATGKQMPLHGSQSMEAAYQNTAVDDDTVELMMQYDEQAKKILGYKTILAFILSKAVAEFKGMLLSDIAELIEGEVLINKVPVDAGHTNMTKGERITGFNTENAETNEGLIRYDILFKVRTDKNSEDAYGIIINVEMQKDEPTSYNLINRAVFYACRLIASEKQREFIHMNFDDLIKVYSIWIVANMESDSVNQIHFTQDTLYGTHKWDCRSDLINLVIAGITGEMRDEVDEAVLNDNDGKVLCGILNTLFATNINDKERFEKLTHHFQITVDNDLKEDMKAMCNLGQGLLEKGEGKKEIENIVSFYMDGDSVERLARVMKKSETEIRQVLVDQGIVLEH